MDSLSSSFLSTMPSRKISPTLIKPLSSPLRINISSVRIEDTSQIARNLPPPSTNPSTLQNPSKKSKSRQPSMPSPYKIHEKQVLKPKPSLTSTLLNTLDEIINKFIDPPTHSSVDPKLVLSHNFAPVHELPPTECEIIEGTLPSCLDGAYIRNGPNPQFFPDGPYHMFDGDGMLHCIRISGGKATLCSRYVKTYKYMIEHEAGTSILRKVFSGFNGLVGFAARAILAAARINAGQYNPRNGVGLANTSVAFFGDRLYALGETDLPYEVRLTPAGDIQTLGRNNFGGKLIISMTAHPKVDQDTGETFAFRYGHVSPFLTYFRFDPKGNKQADVPISSLPRPSLLHDFAITNKYAIFPDIQIEMDLIQTILRGGSPLSFQPSKVSRIGVIPRYANNEKDMRWFEVAGWNPIHIINAWDEVDEDGNEAIVMVAPNVLHVEHVIEQMDLTHSLVEKVIIDLKTGAVSRQPLSARNLDFAVLNPAYLGKKNKYVYAAIGNPAPKVTGVVKLDISMAQDQRDCIVASRMFGPGCLGGEPFFVARDPNDSKSDEDDGYLVSYVHDENVGQSKFLVMDAKSPTLDIVASVKLPQRVPYGFHGLFIRDKDLKKL